MIDIRNLLLSSNDISFCQVIKAWHVSLQILAYDNRILIERELADYMCSITIEHAKVINSLLCNATLLQPKAHYVV